MRKNAECSARNLAVRISTSRLWRDTFCVEGKVKLCVYLIKYHARKTYGDCSSKHSLITVLDGNGQLHPKPFSPRRKPAGIHAVSRSQWPRGLRRRSAAARLLRSWVRIPPGAWMFACCECCVLSGRGLCDELTTRPEESYRLWCVVVCDLEISRIRRPWYRVGSQRHRKKKNSMQ